MKTKTPAQLLKAELKKEFKELIVSCSYQVFAGGDAINVTVKNLFDTNYTRQEILTLCVKYQSDFNFVRVNIEQLAQENMEDIKVIEKEENITIEQVITTEEIAIINDQEIQAQIDDLNNKLTARQNLLIYLKENEINGKIQQATDQEINELNTKIEDLTKQLDPRPKLKLEIEDLEQSIIITADNIANETLEEKLKTIATLNSLKNDITVKLNQIKKHNHIESLNHLKLTLPTTNDQPVKSHFDILINSLKTHQDYQNLIDNFHILKNEFQWEDNTLNIIKSNYMQQEKAGDFILSNNEEYWNFIDSIENLIQSLQKK